jgi:UDP-N-acetylmuramoyl-L-alanyl-D-glutamate--2,6-diaminopimelate ligase
MKLSELTAPFDAQAQVGADLDVEDIVTDSRQAHPGAVFVAVPGAITDGHRFIAAAIERGASALIVENPATVPDGVPYIVMRDIRRKIGPLAARFFGDPSRHLHVVGITGTNGKTSTTYIGEAMLTAAGYSVGVIGTINYRFAGQVIPAPTTTPGPVELQRLLAQMRVAGVTHVLMEVSSHALDQFRVDGTYIDCAVFTNLTRDHLDYHESMAAYLAAKRRLFTDLLCADDANSPTAIVNGDDPAHEEMVAGLKQRVWRFSLNKDSHADIHVRHIRVDLSGTQLELSALGHVITIHSPLIGEHNAQNLMQALAIGLSYGLDLDTVAAGVRQCTNIPGRLERVADPHGIHVFVDYSHTPDALEKVAVVLNRLKGAGRQIIVVGCGGDRDRGKRPLMGEVAGRLGDMVIVTSDNPRTEYPQAILAEIEPGVIKAGKRKRTVSETKVLKACEFAVIESRRGAIRLAIRSAQPGDAILIAGKGHEDYQIIGTVKHHFDDREEALLALELYAGGETNA